MGYTNSPLVVYTGLSPNHSGQRTRAIDRITPHCVVGQLSAETICACFPAGRDASCNYGIGTDGRVSLCVEEKNRSWCTSSNANDQRAITIECASDKTEPYAMSDAVYATLIKLCTDICKRNGKSKLLWFADKDKSLNYAPKSDEMVITVHRWFANKSCPGDWLYARLGDLAAKVTAALGGAQQEPATDKTVWYRVRKTWADSKSQLGAYKVMANAKAKVDANPGYAVFDENGKAIYGTATGFAPYTVSVTIDNLNIRKGPGTNYGTVGKFAGKGCFTIVEEANGQGASKWGLLKSYADGRDGWTSRHEFNTDAPLGLWEKSCRPFSFVKNPYCFVKTACSPPEDSEELPQIGGPSWQTNLKPIDTNFSRRAAYISTTDTALYRTIAA